MIRRLQLFLPLLAIAATAQLAASAIYPPYTEDFDHNNDSGKFKLSDFGFTQIDANGDTDYWDWSKTGGYGRFANLMYFSGETDDYLISPGITLDANTTYDVSFDLGCQYDGYTQKFEILYGTAPTVAGLNGKLLAPTYHSDRAWQTYKGTVKITQTGVYYFALHAMTNDNGGKGKYFCADNFTVKAGVSCAAATAVTDLAVQRDATGLYQAVISFKAPVTDQDGKKLESMTKIDILANGNVVKSFERPEPGASFEYTDVQTAPGYVTYTVTPYNAAGAGQPAEATVHLGVNLPVPPESVTVVEDAATPGVVTASWTPVTKDIDGNDIPEGKVTYLVGYRYDKDGKPIPVTEEAIAETQLTHTAIPEGHQGFYSAMVWAVTESGNSEKYTESEVIGVGTPFDLPWISSMRPEGTQLHFYDSMDGDGQWGVMQDDKSNDIKSQDSDGWFAYFMAFDPGCYSTLWSGKLDFTDAAPIISYHTYNIPHDESNTNANTLEILVEDEQGNVTSVDKVVMMDLPEYNAWNRRVVDLKDFKGHVVRIGFRGKHVTNRYVMLDNVSVNVPADVDLEAHAFTMPSGATEHTTFDAKVVVANNGRNPVSDYKVEILRNGEVIAESAGPEVPFNSRAVVTVPVTDRIVPLTAPYNTYTARVKAEGDSNDINDDATTSAKVYFRKFPMPASPEIAAADGEYPTLTWQAVDPSSPYRITEDFEDYDAWTKGGCGGWKFVDADGLPVQAIEMSFFKNGIFGPQSFWVMGSEAPYTETWPSHSGRRHLMQSCVYGGTTNEVSDWAISPELYGGTQKISLWARGFGGTSLERFEVRYSLTGNDPEDFTELATRYHNIPNEWSEYEFLLLDGARYFAVVCTSEDKWMFGFDDATFTPAKAPEFKVEGHNIYRDGQLAASVGANVTSWSDEAAAEGSNSYRISAVTDKGETTKSAPVTIEYSSVAEIEGGSAEAEYFTLQGVRLPTKPDSGICIRRIGNKVEKIIVR